MQEDETPLQLHKKATKLTFHETKTTILDSHRILTSNAITQPTALLKLISAFRRN
jgi:hypothetical protein